MNYHLAFSKSWITNIHWLLVGITCQFYGCVFVCVKSSGVVKRTFGEIQHPKKNTYFSSTIWHWVFPTLMCACMLSHFNCIQLFVTLWTVAFQAPLSMGLSRQEYWSGLPGPPPGDIPNPGIEPTSLMSLELALVLPGKPPTLITPSIFARFMSVKVWYSWFSKFSITFEWIFIQQKLILKKDFVLLNNLNI